MKYNSISSPISQGLCEEYFRDRSKLIQQFSKIREKSQIPNISIKVLRKVNYNNQPDLPLQDKIKILQMKQLEKDLQENKNIILDNQGDERCN